MYDRLNKWLDERVLVPSILVNPYIYIIAAGGAAWMYHGNSVASVLLCSLMAIVNAIRYRAI